MSGQAYNITELQYLAIRTKVNNAYNECQDLFIPNSYINIILIFVIF